MAQDQRPVLPDPLRLRPGVCEDALALPLRLLDEALALRICLRLRRSAQFRCLPLRLRARLANNHICLPLRHGAQFRCLPPSLRARLAHNALGLRRCILDQTSSLVVAAAAAACPGCAGRGGLPLGRTLRGLFARSLPSSRVQSRHEPRTWL